MGKHTSFFLALISIIWIIISEDLSWRGLAIGLLVAMLCMHFSSVFLPFEEVVDINFYKLATYPIYLITQIILSGVYVAKLVLSNTAKSGIVNLPIRLKSETLRVMLLYSMTLTPGTIPFDFEGDQLKTLWLHSKNIPNDDKLANDMTKIEIEDRLLKAQRNRDVTSGGI